MRGCIAICDDEKVWIDQAYEAVQAYQKEKENKFEIFLYQSAEEYLASEKKADILLLDIKMQNISGIDLKNKLTTNIKGEAIIFMTNYGVYMKEAFGRNVYGFLDKPVSREKLAELFDRILADYELDVELKINDHQFISVGKIMYIKAIDKYVEIYTREGVITGYCSLAECEKILPKAAFMRIHRSFVIHFEYVEKLGTEVRMTGGATLRVGRGKLQILRDSYFRYAKMRAR